MKKSGSCVGPGLGWLTLLRVFVVRGAVMPTNIVRVYICLTVVW